MEPLKAKYIHLDHCRGIRPVHKLKLLKYDPPLEKLLHMPPSSLKKLLNMQAAPFEAFYYDLHHLDIKPVLSLYAKHHIRLLTPLDPGYPSLLKETYQPPLVLYAIGDLSLLQARSLAVVGSRKAAGDAQQVVEQILPLLIKKNFVIASGLARGVDTIAHTAAMKLGGRTIAVLGSGFFHIYPGENKHIAEQIKQNHLLLSEYPPATRPQKWHFPERNRIISGLSEGVLVVQAERRSGSLITADFALQEGREVFSIPGNVLDPLSAGTNHLIQQGAKLVASSEDILEELRMDG